MAISIFHRIFGNMIGRLRADFFPAIFGPNENQPLDVEGARMAFQDLTDEVNAFNQVGGP